MPLPALPVLFEYGLAADALTNNSSSVVLTAANVKIDATRTVTFQGIVIQNGAVQKGFEFFMLPQTAAANSAILSGKVVFQRP